MEMVKRYSFLLLLVVLGFSSKAQLTRDLHQLYNPTNFFQAPVDSSTFEPWNSPISNKPNYSVEIGTSFSSFAGGFTSSFISPSVSFMATERLHIVAGGKFSNASFTNGPVFNNQVGENLEEKSISNPSEVFAYGRYQVNNKLSVYGMGAFGKNQLYVSPFQSGIGSADYQHFSFGMDYKISERTRIGASFGVTSGPAFGVSPFGSQRNFGYNPFFP
jgi:hypothetical protein